MVLATLNYSRYMTSLQDAERKKHERELQAAANLSTSAKHGTTAGLAEEALLAPDGVTGG